MAKVTLTIAGYTHELSCRDGEEAHFLRLAAILDEKAGQAARAVGGLTEIRMLLFAGLLLADETSALRSAAAARAAEPDPLPDPLPDALVVQAVAALAARVEALAEGLEARAPTP